MKHWIDPKPVAVPEALTAQVGGHPVVAQTLARRGITAPADVRRFLDPAAYTPASPYDLPDMDRAVERVQAAIQRGEQILVWGDFDVDGQTATALLVATLRDLNADVTYYIPHRQTEGHGVHIQSLGTHLDAGAKLVVTCDTGVSAHSAVDYAQGRGVDVVVTDHHQLPLELPSAYAVVNSRRLDPDHPARPLPGVGVAYLLAHALYTAAGQAERAADLLDLVALGIVADVVEQTGDARYLLQRGLHTLRHTERAGLQALYTVADLDAAKIDEETIGFMLAPRLNAVGRLADANASVEFLTTSDPVRAATLAQTMNALNIDRKTQTESIYAGAVDLVETQPELLRHPALVVSKADWHGGIVGIVANRLVEAYVRPVVMLIEEADGTAHGSARSVPGCDIAEAIRRVDAAHPGMITHFGGHTMAAGLGLTAGRVADFRRALGREVGDMLGTTDTTPTLTLDAYLSLADLTLDLVHDVRRLAPFGLGNRPLTFATRKVTLKTQRQIGRTKEHLRLTVEDEAGTTQDVLWWRAEPERLPAGRFDLAYTLGINEFQDTVSVQVVLEDLRPVDEDPLTFDQRATVEIVDHRALHQDSARSRLADYPDALVWNEGPALDGLSSVRRQDLKPAETLVIWTIPPGPDEIHHALTTVNPARVVLFGLRPGTDSLNGFLKQLSGLLHYALNHYAGEASLIRLAGALGHRAQTVRAGLRWMVARGHITMLQDGDPVRFQRGGAKAPDQINPTNRDLMAAMQETAAFRAHYLKAEPATIIR
jgi:single-stranded-DNA-specific exonuclease